MYGTVCSAFISGGDNTIGESLGRNSGQSRKVSWNSIVGAENQAEWLIIKLLKSEVIMLMMSADTKW